MKLIPTYPHCGGHNITAKADCTWDTAKQLWDIQEQTYEFFCTTCEDDISYVDMEEMRDAAP